MNPSATTQHAVREVLRTVGPLTTAEIADLLSVPLKRVAVCISCWRKSKRNRPPRVKEWARREGHGGSPIQVWTCGPGRDAPRPKPHTNAEKIRMSRQRNATILLARQRGVVPDPLLSLLT